MTGTMTAVDFFTRRCQAKPGERKVHPFVVDAGSCTVEGVLDPYNSRVKLYGATPEALTHPDAAFLVQGLDDDEGLYSKVTVYARPAEAEAWRERGFRCEGRILGYFRDGDDAAVWAAYGDRERGLEPRREEHDRIVDLARGKSPSVSLLTDEYISHVAEPAHADEIAALLAETFSDYPTPVSAEVVRYAIENGLNVFRLVRSRGDGVLAAVASAEIDRRHMVAELTDCATVPEHRGRGLMAWLLRTLAEEVSGQIGIRDFYTIARADEVGMNCAFAKLGFVYTGRLVNNCRMPNGWESMNLWCRRRRS